MNVVDQDQSKALPGISANGIVALFCFLQGLHNSALQGFEGHQLLAYFRTQPERPYLSVVDAEDEETFFFNWIKRRGFDEAHQDLGPPVIVHIGGVELVGSIGKYGLVELFAGGIQKGEFETRAGTELLEQGLSLEIPVVDCEDFSIRQSFFWRGRTGTEEQENDKPFHASR